MVWIRYSWTHVLRYHSLNINYNAINVNSGLQYVINSEHDGSAIEKRDINAIIFIYYSISLSSEYAILSANDAWIHI